MNEPPASAPLPASSENRPSPIGDRPSVGVRLRAYRLLWVLGAIVFVADQATKFWIAERFPTLGHDTRHLTPDLSITVIPDFFYLIHVGNTGAAWSIFSGKSVLLALLAAVTLVAIFLWRHTLGLRERMGQICFGLLCGGIIGNLVDRLMHGHVIDFIDLHFGGYIYPTFNVADSGICIGVILYMWHSLRAK